MNLQLVSTIIISSFLVLLLIGFLFGLVRGLNRGLVRMLMVIVCLVVAFFCAAPITKALVGIDISNFNVNIDGQQATTIFEAIKLMLSSLGPIKDLVNTESFAVIINVLSQAVLNLVVFLLMFYALRIVTMIIYWIIWGVCFNKKKMQGKSRHRILGGLVGIVQNFVIFLVLFIPLVGMINIVKNVEEGVTRPQTVAVASAVSEQTNSESENGADKILDTVADYIDAYNSTWVAKFMHAVKLDKLCNSAFTNLTTVKYGNTKYELATEVSGIAKIYGDVIEIQDLGGFDLSNPDVSNILASLVNHAYESRLAGNLVDEIIPLAANRWLAGEEFCGIAKPEIENFDGILQSLLTKLAETGSKKALLIDTLDVVKSVMAMKDNLVVDGELNIDQVGDLLKELTKSEELRDFAKDVITDNVENVVEQFFPQDAEGQDYSQYKDMITETLGTVFGDNVSSEQLADDIDALTESLKAADKLMKDETIDEQGAKDLVDSLAKSQTVTDLLTGATSDEQTSSAIGDYLSKNVDDTTKQNLQQAIEESTGLSDELKAQLNKLFGITE